MMEKHGIAADDLDALKALDGTLSYVALGGKLLGAVAFSDQPRAEARAALATVTDLAREAAHVTLMRPDLWLVPASLDIAASTRRVIRQNLVWAFIYNVIGIPLAAFGLLSPVFAGAAMAFSSVSVVTNSARLTRWKPKKTS